MKRLLHRMQRVRAAGPDKSLDRRQRAAVEHRRQQRAALHGIAVEQHHAGAALAGVAADMGAGQVEVLAQQFGDQCRGSTSTVRDRPLSVKLIFICEPPGLGLTSGKNAGTAGRPGGQQHVADIEGIAEENPLRDVGDEVLVGSVSSMTLTKIPGTRWRRRGSAAPWRRRRGRRHRRASVRYRRAAPPDRSGRRRRDACRRTARPGFRRISAATARRGRRRSSRPCRDSTFWPPRNSAT